MTRKFLVALALLGLVAAACGDDAAQPTAQPVTIEVDAKSDVVNTIAFAFFPDTVTAHPGDTIRFHSNFRGEPHTVTFGAKIDEAIEIFNQLTPEQQRFEEPPPPAFEKKFEALNIPFFFPEEEVPPEQVKLNQAAGQACFLATGDAPESGPCTKVAQPAFTGAQAFYNSGFLPDDETFSLTLARTIAPGTYNFFCLVHGPEMRGTVEVVADTQTAQTAAQVASAGRAKIDELATKLKAEADKAAAELDAGTVQSGVQAEGIFGGATEFLPKEISVPAGGTVTWKLGFHTVSFNAPEDARPIIVQDADGTVRINLKTVTPVNSPKVEPPRGGGPEESEEEPKPVVVNGGKWDGAGIKSSGLIEAPGEVQYKVTFTKAGTYKYVCLIHPDMEGTVKVG